MAAPHVVVVGAGMGGLAAALDLAAKGTRVTLLERHATPGGKMRTVTVDGRDIDSGPTVFTMRWVFEDLFAAAGLDLDTELGLERAYVLARHSWPDGSRLDLFEDVHRSVEAIGAFAGTAAAQEYARFAERSARVFETLDLTFMRRQKPGPVALTLAVGLTRLHRLFETRPFVSLWRDLGRTFGDPRLRQLFARYATYTGSSPLLAPATLMLIAHAEQRGVWYVQGGMRRLADRIAAAAEGHGATLRYGAQVGALDVERGRVRAVRLADGERIEADAVVFNGDPGALLDGHLGDAVREAVRPPRGRHRALSAVTWSLVARTRGFPLAHHTVFFGEDYPDEFRAVFARGTVTENPTVYVCAQDRGSAGARIPERERLFLLVNAPPAELSGDHLEAIGARVERNLREQGLELELPLAAGVRTTPEQFGALFPGTRGALYGRPTHGMTGSFDRPGARSRLPGLYLAGGGVHPGPGIPMATLSGRLAAARVLQDLAPPLSVAPRAPDPARSPPA